MPTAEWQVVIADDEPAARRGVRQLLATFPEFSVAAECRDGAEVLATLERLRPDLLFLDIQMPGIDGFEVIRRRTPERMPVVVFLTAHDQFAVRAFEAQALDYLLKPVTESRFAATMQRVGQQLRLARTPSRDAAVIVTTTRGEVVIPIREIDWIEAADNYARIWTGGRTYMLRRSMREMEARMSRYGFVRAHRRALVRISDVRALSTTPDGETIAELASGGRVPISRRRRTDFAAAVRKRFE